MKHDCPHCQKTLDAASLAVSTGGSNQMRCKSCGGALEISRHPEEFLEWLTLLVPFLVYAKVDAAKDSPGQFWLSVAVVVVSAVGITALIRLRGRQRYRRSAIAD
jgi:hypothetical protein